MTYVAKGASPASESFAQGGSSSRDAAVGDVVVEFRGVRKIFGNHIVAVENLNLDVHRGEFLTLLGPSGSGKTTTLMMLAGFQDSTGGEIILDGSDVTLVPAHKRDIGVVFQQYALFPHMTVAENLAYPLRVRRMSRSEIEDRVKRILDVVQLQGFGDRRPTELSGGQQQRIAVARALVFEPKVVLMDEPLGALDKRLRDAMQLEIKHLHERLGLTIVYVTHDQTEALVMSDRVAVFDKGSIQQLSDPRSIYAEPASSFVAHFIGESNRLDGKVESIENRFCMVRVGGGHLVRARAIKVESVGGATSLAVRPEAVRVNAPATDMENNFSGLVKEVIYLGNHVRLRIGAFGENDLITEIQTSGGSDIPDVGETVRISWRAEDCRALDVLTG